MQRISVTTSTSTIKCEEFQKKHDSSPKNVDFFENFKKKQDFEKYFDFSKIFENFRTPQNRSIVVRFQFSALWDQIPDRGTKNRALTTPLGQCFDNYVHKVVSHVPMLVCVISVRSH